MKKTKSKKSSYQIAAVLVMISLVGVFFISSFTTPVYAENIVITGDAAGSLIITSTDTTLFDLTGLYPGDRSTSSITIRNTDMVNEGFDVLMYAENTSEALFDLGRVTRLKITDGNIVVYDGFLVDFDDNFNRVTPVHLCRLGRGTEITYDFEIELDGMLADNNYQEQQSSFIVTFAAYSYGAPTIPEVTPLPTMPPPVIDIPGEDIPETIVTLEAPIIPLANFELPEDETPEPIIPEPINDAPVEENPLPDVELEDPVVPLADFETHEEVTPEPEPEPEPEEPETVELEDPEVPLAEKDMPKTGEPGLAVYIVPGVMLICLGLIIIKTKRKIK